MNPRFKTVLSEIGNIPTLPKLPPVYNLRPVSLKKGLTQAERDLHDARIALRALEDYQKLHPEPNPIQQAEIGRRSHTLYTRMRQLEVREAEYFANSYITKQKPAILHGWKNKGKQRQFTRKLSDVGNQIGLYLADIQARVGGGVLHPNAETAAQHALDAYGELRLMDRNWYQYTPAPASDRIYPRLENPQNDLTTYVTNVRTIVGLIKAQLNNTLALQPSPAHSEDKLKNSIREIQTSLHRAETCLHMAHQVKENNWHFPMD